MIKLDARSQPRQKRSRERVDYILDTAEQLVMKLGYESVTAQMISQQTNISPGVVYHYFPGKHGIFAAVAKRAFKRLEMRMRKIYSTVSPEKPYEVLVDEIVDDLADYWRENQAAIQMWQALMHSPRLDPVTNVLKKQAVDRNAAMLKAYFPSLSKSEVATKAMIMEEICFCLLGQLFDLASKEANRVIKELKTILKSLVNSPG